MVMPVFCLRHFAHMCYAVLFSSFFATLSLFSAASSVSPSAGRLFLSDVSAICQHSTVVVVEIPMHDSIVTIQATVVVQARLPPAVHYRVDTMYQLGRAH